MTTKRVAILDDDPLIRMLVEEYLKAFGFEVTAFETPHAALAAMQQTPPDLLVLDLQMPVMNGFQVLTAMRADPATSEIPVLLLSANAGDASTMSETQPDRYLSKPFQMKELLEAVQSTRRDPMRD